MVEVKAGGDSSLPVTPRLVDLIVVTYWKNGQRIN